MFMCASRTGLKATLILRSALCQAADTGALP